MMIIKKNTVPLYESTCPECKSVFRYTKAETSMLHIECPVCGYYMWANLFPVEEKGKEDGNV